MKVLNENEINSVSGGQTTAEKARAAQEAARKAQEAFQNSKSGGSSDQGKS